MTGRSVLLGTVFVALVWGLGLVVLGATPAEAEEFPLSWHEASRDELVSGLESLRSAASAARPLPGKPQSVHRLPAGIGNAASYFSVSLAGKEYVVVVDNATRPKFYADTDGDGDLAEETPFPLPPEASRGPGGDDDRVLFLGPLEFASAGQPAEAAVRAYAQVFLGWVVMYPARYRSGKVRFGNRVCAVALVDTNGNGAYSDAFSLPFRSGEMATHADMLAVDLNGDGQFRETRRPLVFEVLPLPRMLAVDGTYYSIEVPADGSKVRVERVEPKMGTLAVGGAAADLVLLSESGFHVLESASAPWRLPVGKYFPIKIVMKKAGGKGAVWRIPVFVADRTKAKLVEVAGGQTTLELPLPTRARVTVELARDQATFHFALEGPGGLGYSPDVQVAREQRPPEPRFEVTDESGKVVLADVFRYGGGAGPCLHSWRVPPEYKGKPLTLTVTADLGPFGSWRERTTFTP